MLIHLVCHRQIFLAPQKFDDEHVWIVVVVVVRLNAATGRITCDRQWMVVLLMALVVQVKMKWQHLLVTLAVPAFLGLNCFLF